MCFRLIGFDFAVNSVVHVRFILQVGLWFVADCYFRYGCWLVCYGGLLGVCGVCLICVWMVCCWLVCLHFIYLWFNVAVAVSIV